MRRCTFAPCMEWLDSFVATLRKKVEVDAHAPLHIRTVHGVGYKFDPDAAD